MVPPTARSGKEQMMSSFTTRDPFEVTRWDLVPHHTAVVIIDPQNDFLHFDGQYAKAGVDIGHMRRTIGPITELVAAARARNVPIVWTRHGFRDRRDAGVFMSLRPFLAEAGLRQGTWGYEVLDGLGALQTDWYVEKQRLSAFFNTNLELVLRSLKAEVLLIGGVLTNQCVAATSKDANFRDFKPIVIEETTGTTLPHLHGPAIEMIKVGWGEVRSLSETLCDLEALPAN
jgi:ureidoacrylate peracid hydrolase